MAVRVGGSDGGSGGGSGGGSEEVVRVLDWRLLRSIRMPLFCLVGFCYNGSCAVFYTLINVLTQSKGT